MKEWILSRRDQMKGTRSLVLKTQWTSRHEKVLPMAVIALESPE